MILLSTKKNYSVGTSSGRKEKDKPAAMRAV
jgi:hypothetical protein